jgi:hypothetical protein
MSKCTVLVLNLTVHTVTVVSWRVNYCVKCAEGGAATGSGLKCSGWVDEFGRSADILFI